MDHDAFTDRLSEIGISPNDLPRSTLRNWAREGLIPGPEPYTKKGRRGRFRDWPDEALEEAAAVWALRNLEAGWFLSPPPSDMVKRIKLAANAISEKFRNNPKSYEGVFRKQYDPNGDEFDYIISYDLHPFIVSWINSVEKVKKKKSVRDPAKVIFDWNNHLIYENGVECSELKFDGVKLEPSDQNTVTLHVGYTPEVKEKLLDKMRTDVGKYGLKELSKEKFDEIERSAARSKKQKNRRKKECCSDSEVVRLGLGSLGTNRQKYLR